MFIILRTITVFLVLTNLTSANTGLKLTTYNAGLAHTFVKYATERVEKVAEGLAQLDSDVICLQEVWTK